MRPLPPQVRTAPPVLLALLLLLLAETAYAFTLKSPSLSSSYVAASSCASRVLPSAANTEDVVLLRLRQHSRRFNSLTQLWGKKAKRKGGGSSSSGYGSGNRPSQPQQEKQSVKDARFDAVTRQFMFTMVGLTKILPDKSKTLLNNINLSFYPGAKIGTYGNELFRQPQQNAARGVCGVCLGAVLCVCLELCCALGAVRVVLYEWCGGGVS